jgi:hypothetical protein
MKERVLWTCKQKPKGDNNMNTEKSTLEKLEMMMEGVSRQTVAQALISDYLRTIKQKASEGTLTDADCINGINHLAHLMDWGCVYYSPDSQEMEIARMLLDRVPHFTKGSAVKSIVERIKNPDEMDKAAIFELVNILKEKGMTRKQIKREISKHLNVEQHKIFMNLLAELEKATAKDEVPKDMVGACAEAIGATQSKSVSRDAAARRLELIQRLERIEDLPEEYKIALTARLGLEGLEYYVTGLETGALTSEAATIIYDMAEVCEHMRDQGDLDKLQMGLIGPAFAEMCIRGLTKEEIRRAAASEGEGKGKLFVEPLRRLVKYWDEKKKPVQYH